MVNTIQLLLFLFFAAGAFLAGLAVFSFINAGKTAASSNRAVCMGEALLLGSAVIYGLFMLLSLLHLYRKDFLFAAVALNYGWLFLKSVREGVGDFFSRPLPRSVSFYVLIVFMALFIFRNYFFMYDVDSHHSYLFAQKLWLLNGTSVFGSDGHSALIFAPHFEDVLGALGLSWYPQEFLYGQFINIFFRIIAVLLVYGYTTYRLGSLYGLAGACFLLFNLHFYVSGANKWVLMNGALIAFYFAAVYSFFESYRAGDKTRLFMGLLFLTQFPSNKYQIVYNLLLILVLGFWMQPRLVENLKGVFREKRNVYLFLIFIGIASLHYIKNWIATGNPFFPVFAGHLHTFGRELQMEEVFNEVSRGVSWNQWLKYIGFLFMWHGMRPAYWVFVAFLFLPVIALGAILKSNVPLEKIKECMYWLAMSVLGIGCICWASHQDPRYYVYVIGVLAFASIFVWDYVMSGLLGLKGRLYGVTQLLIIIFCFQGANIVLATEGLFGLVSFKDNLAVIKDEMHSDDMIRRYFPNTLLVNKAFEDEPELMAKTAYAFYLGPPEYSLALVVPRPIVSHFWTSVVNWYSYENESSIAADIKRHNIEYLIDVRGGQVVRLTPELYAQEAVKFNRFPSQVIYEYGFPIELKYTDFRGIKK